MAVQLFFQDTQSHLGVDALRAAARDFVRRTPLVSRAASGDRAAAIGLHTGFWPFVSTFERAIDEHPLPRAPLLSRFRDARTLRSRLAALARAVREMKEEEGSHAAHWVKDASQLGIDLSPVDADGSTLPAMRELVDSAYTREPAAFFGALAGTELVAEELSALLIESPAFTSLFERGRWVWGEIHLMPHEHGPSHLDIDLDLARAYADDDSEGTRVVKAVLDTIDRFEAAALEVHASCALREAA